MMPTLVRIFGELRRARGLLEVMFDGVRDNDAKVVIYQDNKQGVYYLYHIRGNTGTNGMLLARLFSGLNLLCMLSSRLPGRSIHSFG